MAIFPANPHAAGSVQELQVPPQVGWQIRRGHQQGQQLQAHNGSRGASRRAAILRRPINRPDEQKFDAITLERGLTQDMNFHDWAGLVWNFGAALGSEVSLANFRKDIYLEFYNEAGQLVIAYKIYRCWVSEYQALPGPGRQRQRHRHRAYQAGKRRLGARHQRDRTARTDAQQCGRLATASRRSVPLCSVSKKQSGTLRLLGAEFCCHNQDECGPSPVLIA